jgi:serine/threonine protein kinase/Tfp pilus assembly protein PilF
MIGRTISHYKIVEKLGEGGMGVVYKAEDMKLGRIIALKFLPAHLSSSEQDKARFIQEAKAASALNHPNVCTIHDIQEHDGQIFIVMEFVDGDTLRAKKSGISIRQAIDIGIQLADGLAAAHEKGIVHRDIKSDNIMVRPDGRAQIMDFGLAKLQGVSALTRAGSTIGTTMYMSPEQIQSIETDHRTDIFSLGVVMYDLLTGQMPFKGAHEAAIMYEVVNVVPQSIRSLNPGVEPGLELIVMKCLEKDRNARYQSAREIAADLRMFKRDTEGKDDRATWVNDSLGKSPRKPTWRSVKLIVSLVPILILTLIGLYFFKNRGGAIESLAVLPFVNASADSSMEYLSDGITESLINSLSQLPKLRVMSRNSVFRFKGDIADPQSVGQKLGVRAVLLGRVRQRGDNLHISVELIDASDNSHLWGEQYERKSADILLVQSEITKEISQKLRLRLADKDSEHLAKLSTENTEAYQFYLKGRYHWNKRSADGLRRAIDYFQQAVEADSNYALAYSGMADAYGVLGWFEYGIVSPRDVLPKARTAAQKAVDLDPDRAESYASLAYGNMVYDYDFVSSERNFNRAFELNPSYATAHQWHAEVVMAQGHTDKSIEEMKHALTLDPLSLIITRDVGWMLYFARRYDEANEYFRKALELDPNFLRGHLILGESYVQQGKIEQAISEFEIASRLSQEATIPTDPYPVL